MHRRQFLKVAAGGSVLALGGAVWLLPQGSRPAGLSTDQAQQFLAQLEVKTLHSIKGWSPAQVFNHCAQSIEYSMSGFPELKPEWFRRTAGPLAFNVFAARGAMHHPLDEPIPGAGSLLHPAMVEQALARLQEAFSAFDRHQGPLAPHFAYGELSHEQYAQAHVLHLNNHMSWLRLS